MIRTPRELFWSAWPAHQGYLEANDYLASGWETFVIERIGGKDGDLIGDGDGITLRAWSGLYIMPSNGGWGSVDAIGSEQTMHFKTLRLVDVQALGEAPRAAFPREGSEDDWIECAGEGQWCNTGAGEVMLRYGNPNAYVYMQVEGVEHILCDHHPFTTTFGLPLYRFLGDHAPNQHKSCAYQPVPRPGGRFVRCADEGEMCNLRNARDYPLRVRYGIDGKWIYDVATDAFQCSNYRFGIDVAPNVRKRCEVGGPIAAFPRHRVPGDFWGGPQNQSCALFGFAGVSVTHGTGTADTISRQVTVGEHRTCGTHCAPTPHATAVYQWRMRGEATCELGRACAFDLSSCHYACGERPPHPGGFRLIEGCTPVDSPDCWASL